MCDPQQSGIENDRRTSYYFDVEKYTNMSKAESGVGGSYGHSWKPTTAAEMIRFDGILIKDGVLGGTDGALYHRWDRYGPC